ncbi:hypothetical protein PsorP6_013316 [Peronosclerospora sorghi]|uniref:Uncharacterized protein n=1 Tax=Peronosclerospora sorghi TaxID=230839 RepID=A0ACC0WHZ6_9STRA|nr:hypothetical protein PsorP6_013316 [Peronosclerospora sorghi]
MAGCKLYSPPDGSPVAVIERKLAVTDHFLYLLEKRIWHPVVDPKSTWEPPLVYLRRRLQLTAIEEITLSTLADPYFVLKASGMGARLLEFDPRVGSEKATNITRTSAAVSTIPSIMAMNRSRYASARPSEGLLRGTPHVVVSMQKMFAKRL